MKLKAPSDTLMINNPHETLKDGWKRLVRIASSAGPLGKLVIVGLDLLFIATPFLVFFISLFLLLLFWPSIGFLSVIVATLFSIVLIIMLVGISSFSFSGDFPVLMLFAFVGSAVALCLSLFSFTSYALASYYLHEKGEIIYRTQEAHHWATFVWLYLWHLIDMIPLIEAWKYLPLQSPPKPLSLIGGLLLLVFRIVILLSVIQLLRRYFAARKRMRRNE